MLQELESIRQIKGEPERRWFSDDFFDLIVWRNESGVLTGFQLCYDRENRPRALTWHAKGYLHHAVSDGEDRSGMPKATPILVPDGSFDKKRITDAFARVCGSIDGKISAFVLEKLKAY
jgi:hypothetical protein